MLETILKKLQVSSINEFFENENRILKKYKGMEIERENPLTRLNKEEMDFFESFILPQYVKAKNWCNDISTYTRRCFFNKYDAPEPVHRSTKIDGIVCYKDPQTGNPDVSHYFDKMQERTTTFFRIDNTEVNEEFVWYIARNNRKW